jgi:hypothetical protein
VVRGRWESVTQEARPDFVLTVVGAQDRWWQEDVDLQMIVGKKEVTVTEAWKTERRPSMRIHVSITRLSRGVHCRFRFLLYTSG